MTGYRSKFFRHNCQIKGCYIGLLPSWDDIIECLPRNIRPTDIDGMVECNRHFLIIEEKSPNKALEHGQWVALKHQSEQPNTTVVVIRMAPESPAGMQALWFPQPNGFQDITREEFLGWITDWGTFACTHPPREWRYIEDA